MMRSESIPCSSACANSVSNGYFSTQWYRAHLADRLATRLLQRRRRFHVRHFRNRHCALGSQRYASFCPLSSSMHMKPPARLSLSLLPLFLPLPVSPSPSLTLHNFCEMHDFSGKHGLCFFLAFLGLHCSCCACLTPPATFSVRLVNRGSGMVTLGGHSHPWWTCHKLSRQGGYVENLHLLPTNCSISINRRVVGFRHLVAEECKVLTFPILMYFTRSPWGSCSHAH